MKDEPACKPLKFVQFLNLLDDVEWCSNVIQQKLSLLDGSAYKKSKELYQEGVAKLKASRFESPEDAMSSLKIVLKRAFGCLSIETKRTKDGPVQYISCANAKPKTKEAKHHCTRLPHTVNMPVTANCNFFFF